MGTNQPVVLLTGDKGHVGRRLAHALKRAGFAIAGFDVQDGRDVRDAEAVAAAASGTAAIVHCAVVPFGHEGSEEEMFAVNVGGTVNVLAAAEAAGHDRVILFSSIHVFGRPGDAGFPTKFPIRDHDPRLATHKYGRSKVAVEQLCAAFTERTGIATVCFRPAHVWVPGQAADWRRRWEREPEREWTPAWDFGAFIDARDVASAVSLALTKPLAGHHGLTLCAPDMAATRPSESMVAQFFPGVPFEPGWLERNGPQVALFDTRAARELLGWAPRHTWAEGSQESWAARIRRRLGTSPRLG